MKSNGIGSIERRLEKKVPAIGLALFRISFGLVTVHEIAFLIYFRHLIFDPIPYLETAAPVLTWSLLIWLGTAICLVFGLFTWVCSIANYCFWVLFVLLTPFWHDFDGGFDQLMTSSSFILIFIHSERRLSLDNLRLRLNASALGPSLSPETRVPVIYYYILIGISLGLLYFDAAIHKLHSEIWMNGLGAWVPNTMPYYISPLDLDWFVNSERLQKLIGYSLIVFQLVFLFFFTRRLFRVPLLIFGVFFHLGIIFCLNIYPFGFGMLIHYVLLVPFKWWAGLAERLRYSQPRLSTYCNNADRGSQRLATILEHFDVRNYSTFYFVSGLNELPEVILKDLSDFGAFTLASVGRHNEIHRGPEGFVENAYFRLLIAVLRILDGVRFLWNRGLAQIPSGFGGMIKRSRPGIFSSGFRAIFGGPASEVPLKSIFLFLAMVLILQANVTLYYGIFKRLDINGKPERADGLFREVSVYATSLSHSLLGVTPHALYMDDHFAGYQMITAFTYIDSLGNEQWVPFVAPDGRLVSPSWGRIHSMWANVAMHPPFDKPTFERLARKVTAFWADKLGIGTEDSTFLVKSKPVQVSFRWLKDLRKKNLGGAWSNFGAIRWRDGQFSIDYRPKARP